LKIFSPDFTMPSNSEKPTSATPSRRIRVRQMIGKYRVEKKIGTGGFAAVYAAFDTIEGVHVALKIPHDHHVSPEMLELFRQEVRLATKLDHPHVLRLKDASVIDGRFVVVTLLGKQTLDDRLKKRISVTKALSYAKQMISAVAYAHELGLIHCDIKPDNFILFEDDHLKLSDFGIAKVCKKTIEGSGTGTVGHMSPEQAMGKPSMRSDVFSLGLIIYRMLSGYWPEFPFDWPPPGVANLRKKSVHPELVQFIRKSISIRPRDRFADAIQMRDAFQSVNETAIKHLQKVRKAHRLKMDNKK